MWGSITHSLRAPTPGYCTRYIGEKKHKSPCTWLLYPQFSLYPHAPSPVADKWAAKVQMSCHLESQRLALFLPLVFLPLARVSSLSC
jgi:hypothetical protein